MAKGDQDQRVTINFFDGVNTAVSRNVFRRGELSHVENARAPIIGVLEKREGQTKKGTATNGSVFLATANYGIVKFPNDASTSQGIFRISDSDEPSTNRSVEVHENIAISEGDLSLSFSSPTYSLSADSAEITLVVVDDVSITEPSFFSHLDDESIIVDGSSEAADIYTLTTGDTWSKLSDSDAQDIIGAPFSSTMAEGILVLVNQKDHNRTIASDGTTVVPATTAGNLFNSPRSSKVAFYKSRIYLGDFIRNGVRYKTSILRSSLPVGIIALANGDHASHASGTDLDVTDTKYFYSDSGMNTYEVYRGGTLITTLTVTTVNETSITVTHSGTPTINSSDEIWVEGTFSGGKQFRWVNNPTSIGKDVKQYDTFRLSGGEEDPLTIMEPIGNVLMLANKNAMMTWNDYTLENFDLGIGCASSRGSVKLLGTLFFLHYSGIYSTTGGVPKLISRKVERYIKGATKSGLENAATGYKGFSVFFALGDVTLNNADGSFWKTLEDVCLEYSVTDQNWYVHTNVPAEEFETFIDNSGDEHLLMAHSGNEKSIKTFLDGNTDDGDEVFFRVDLQNIQLMKEFEKYATVLRVVTETERGTLMKCFVSLDGEDFYEIQGSVLKGCSILKVTSRNPAIVQPPLARNITISYRDSSKQLCRLSQAAIVYMPTTIEEPS